MTLTARAVPPAVAYTKNPIVFAWETDMSETYNDRMIMKLFIDQDGVYVQIGEIEKRPNTSAFFQFDVSEILDAAIQEYDILAETKDNWDVPLIKCTKTIKKYKIEVVERWGSGDDLLDESIEPIEAWCVKGGVGHEAYPLMEKYFEEYLLDTQKFLTWLPRKMTITPGQPITLFLYNYSGSSWNNLHAHFSLTLLDESSNTISTELVVKDVSTVLDIREILMVPAGIFNAALNEEFPDKKIIRYTVTILNDETVVSETRTYLIDYILRIDDKYFAYLNSLGGIDHIRTTGRIDPKAEYTSGNYEREKIPVISDSDATYDPTRALKGDFNNSETFGMKVFSGPMTYRELDAFRDFRLSPLKLEYLIYEANPRYLPIVLDVKSFSYPKSNEFPFTLEFIYKYAFENKVFSPRNSQLS